MIDPRELRIGNYVKSKNQPDGFYIDAYSILRCDRLVGDYEPIPLTEVIVKKLGSFFTFGDNFTCRLRPTEGSVYKVTIEEYSEGEYDLPHIKYLHQYQNLYFDLKGEELTINL